MTPSPRYNTIAIQKCLDAASAKRKDVHIPAGTYLVSGPAAFPQGTGVLSGMILSAMAPVVVMAAGPMN